MRNLKQIEMEFTTAVDLNEPQRTGLLVRLMNELEQHYGTLIFNPSPEEMERPDVKLYRKISLARDL